MIHEEQIAIYKAMNQILADAGIDRNTVKQLVEDVVSVKVERAIKNYTNSISILDNMIRDMVKEELAGIVRQEVRNLKISLSCNVE